MFAKVVSLPLTTFAEKSNKSNERAWIENTKDLLLNEIKKNNTQLGDYLTNYLTTCLIIKDWAIVMCVADNVDIIHLP